MVLTRRTFLLSAVSLALLTCYQKLSYACNVEAAKSNLTGIGLGVATMWGITAVEVLAFGATLSLEIPVLVTVGALVVALAIVNRNKECLSNEIHDFLGF